MNNRQKFEGFLESLKGNGQDALIESVKQGFQVCFEDIEGGNYGSQLKNDISDNYEQVKNFLETKPEVFHNYVWSGKYGVNSGGYDSPSTFEKAMKNFPDLLKLADKIYTNMAKEGNLNGNIPSMMFDRLPMLEPIIGKYEQQLSIDAAKSVDEPPELPSPYH